jgi:hypothetical protein
MKRVVIISDLQCGSAIGLTHPDYEKIPSPKSRDFQFYLQRREYWDYYEKKIKSLQPINALIVNGDCIEGKGERSGGTELIETDREAQADMASLAIKICKADSIFMTYGTPYHTGVTEDFENMIFTAVGADDICDEGDLDINGLIFNYRHFVSSSQSPMGRHLSINKEKIWNLIWADMGNRPNANIIIRSHVHYFGYYGNANYLCITTPSLQGHGSKFGARRMSGVVDFGLIHFDVEGKDNWKWERHILKPLMSQRQVKTIS